MSITAHIYFDESGGWDQGHLIIAGVIVLGDDKRTAAEREWTKRDRKARKGRKWNQSDFEYFASFLHGHGIYPVGCFVRLTEDVRAACERRVKDAAAMGVHAAHGATNPLRAYSLLWQHLSAQFVGVCLMTFALPGAAVDSVAIYPDQSSMPSWQMEIVRQSFGEATGPNLGRHVMDALRGNFDQDEVAALVARCLWDDVQFNPDTKSHRLIELADGYCSLCARFLKGDAAAALIDLPQRTPDIPLLVDATAPFLWRLRMGWIESASTFFPKDLRSAFESEAGNP